MATILGDVRTYKRITLTFKDAIEKTINLSLDNPKNIADGDYAGATPEEKLASQDAALDGVMDLIVAKNIFHNNGNDLTVAYNAREIDYSSKDVKD